METQFCPVHPATAMAELGRMTLDGPLEYACEFCMNGFDYPDLKCVKNPAECAGALEIYFSTHGMAMVLCHSHAMASYERTSAVGNARYGEVA